MVVDDLEQLIEGRIEQIRIMGGGLDRRSSLDMAIIWDSQRAPDEGQANLLERIRMIGYSSLKSSRVVNIEDIRSLAQRRLPRVVFDYLDGVRKRRSHYGETDAHSKTLCSGHGKQWLLHNATFALLCWELRSRFPLFLLP
jgi:hypothetical protein